MFLMGKCTVNKAFYFKECLDSFCQLSGQYFNSRKSNILFNDRAICQTARLITTMMGFDRIDPKSSYLGLPLFRSGFCKDFEFLVERMEATLASWKTKILSKAKRVILIKSVALSLPIYAMQSIKVPSSICAKLDARVRNFWLSNSDSNK
ncbi:hypothetical protein UlMin_009320 [Ulmus minor]